MGVGGWGKQEQETGGQEDREHLHLPRAWDARKAVPGLGVPNTDVAGQAAAH